MKRFAKVSEAALDALPTRLVGRYARLAMVADFGTGDIAAQSWPDLAGAMRCSDRTARRLVDEMMRAGVLSGNPPESLRIDTSASTSGGTSDNTPIYQSTSERHLRTPKKSGSAITLWEDFCEGRRGERISAARCPRKFAELMRASDIPFADLRTLCRLAGGTYADWNGPVKYENVIDRGLEAQSRGEGVAGQTTEDWLNGR